MFVSSQSKHKDEAFKVIDLISSLDVQRKMVSTFPSVSPLKDQKVRDEFGSRITALKGKNVQSIFKNTAVSLPPIHELQQQGTNILNKKFDEVMKGKDINTALREAEAEINQVLSAQSSK
jgi:multiple sugar transport system substrate-binding protein